MNITKLLAMGGYASYVWPAYIIVIGVLAVNLRHAIRKNTQVKQKLYQRIMREQHQA